MISKYLQKQIIYNNIFSKDECEKIIQDTRNLPDYNGSIGAGKTNSVLDLSVRKTKLKYLSPSEKENLWFSGRLAKYAFKANNDFFGFEVSNLSPLSLLEYTKEGHYEWHIDIGSQEYEATRKLSIVVFLSDPNKYIGGKLLWFPDSSYIPSQEQGMAVIFPSYQAHKVEPVIKGTRFTLVGWLHGKNSFI